MKLVQPILLVLLAVALVVYFARLRSSLLDRAIVLLVVVVGAVFVSFPGASQTIAGWVNVGRGVDLVFYLSIFGLGFYCLVLFSKIRRLEADMTDLARAVAIRDANEPEGES